MEQGRLVRVTLTGQDAEPGRVAAADVARVILGVERAMQRAAAVIAPTKRRGATGRHISAVERAAHLRFVEVGRGSFYTVLALPDDVADEEALPVSVADLSERALERVLDVINSEVDVDREIASAIAQIGEELGVGERTDRVVVERVDTPTGLRTQSAQIDERVCAYMRQVSLGVDHPSRQDIVTGSLVEADFERNTARLRLTPPGSAVVVRFPDELADEVKAALREPTELEGRVTYDSRTAMAKSVEVRAVHRGEQLHLGDLEAFWRPRSVAELAREQGITEPPDLTAPLVPDLTPEERADLALFASET
jgi:hypothetical protein